MPAGELLISVVPALKELPLEGKGTLAIGDLKQPFEPGSPVRFSGLSSDRAHKVLVDGPFHVGPVEVRFENAEQGQTLELAALPIVVPLPVDVTAPDEPEPEKRLQIELSSKKAPHARWLQRRGSPESNVVWAMPVVPTSGPLRMWLAEEWKNYGHHKDEGDQQLDVLELAVPVGLPVQNVVDFATRLNVPERPFRATNGETEMRPVFQVRVVRPQEPSPLTRPLDPSLAKLASAPMAEALAPGYAEKVEKVIQACVDRAKCDAKTLIGTWTRLAVAQSQHDKERAIKSFWTALAIAQPTEVHEERFLSYSRDKPELTLDEGLPDETESALKDAYKRPLPTGRLGATSVSGRAALSDIARALQSRFPFWMDCYLRGLARSAELQGRVAARLIIGNDGVVASTSNAGSDLPDKNVRLCFVQDFYRLPEVKPAGGIVTVTVPIIFSPRP